MKKRLLVNDFEHSFRIEATILLYIGVLVRLLNLHRDKKSYARTGERCS